LWNAWWCGCCNAINLVGDGGKLSGACIGCQKMDSKKRNAVMLDPDKQG
jgi:hypothetical protein